MSQTKLEILASMNGYCNELEMLESASSDSIAPSICMNDGCDYTTDGEPDMREGYCEECATNTVESCLVIAGVI